MTDDILEPVKNDAGELYWLTRHYEKHSTSDLNKPMDDIIKENKPLLDAPVFVLRPQGQWFCNKCGGVIQSNPGPPIECFKEQGGCGRTSSFKTITEIIQQGLWVIPRWEDIKNLDSGELFNDIKELMQKTVLFSDDIYYDIFSLWIISTWKIENWDTIGYPVFLGLKNSGKSTALLFLKELCYRAIKASGVKFASIPRLTHYWNITLLVDECHNKLDPKNDTGRELLDFVKDSYKKGSTYITCDLNDQKKVIVTNNFGSKAFAGEKTFDPAMLSRSFVVWMDKGKPDIPKLRYAEKEFNELRTKLLNYRYKTGNPPDLGKDFVLTGRTREIFESIIATGKHIGIDVQQIIDYAQEREKGEEEDLQNSLEHEILSWIQVLSCYSVQSTLTEKTDAPGKVTLKDIREKLGWEEIEDKDEKRKKSQLLGYILKDMGLRTTRKTDGYVLSLMDKRNDKRLTNLYKRYGL